MDLQLTPKQVRVLQLIQNKLANEILFGGAAGGGKSHLLRAISIIWSIYVPGVQVYLFRRKVKDLVATHLRGPSGFPVLLKEFVDDKLCKINYSNNYIEFENGSVISLNHCQHEADLNNFLSAEIHILLFDESTTFTEKMIRMLRSRLRLGSLVVPEHFRGCLPFIIYATNPRGESHSYFKTKFVDANKPGVPFRATAQEGGMMRVFVPSLLSDNPHIEKEYADRLRGLGDPDVVEAYLAGDWSVVEGAALSLLSRKHHVINSKNCSIHWPVHRAYDYGFSAPYFVIYYMIANGESETEFNPPKGSIILHTEIYGANLDMDTGLREDVGDTTKKMRMHETLHYSNQVQEGPADSSIFDKEQGPSIYDSIQEEEPTIIFVPADKSPGSRAHGLSEIRRYIYNAVHYRNERPGLYMTELCKYIFQQLSALQLDEKNIEDVNTKQNDHSYDVVRYITLHQTNQISFMGVEGL